MAEPMSLQIITPDAIVFEGKSTFFVGKAIDIDRAERAKERAEGRLSNPTPDIDVERAEHALARALLRLKVTKRI